MVDWDIKKLRILRALADTGTVTAAAEALHMTPSAVSQQLSGLAKQVGAPLLEAHGRRVRLTEAAHLVLRHADTVFAQLERADAELTGYLSGDVGEVRVSAFSTAVPALVVPAVTELRRTHPGLHIRVTEAEAEAAYELLAAGEADLALSLAAHAPSARDPRFKRVELLADEPWIYGSSGPWSDITLAACEAAGFTPEQAHAAADWSAILAMVAAGMGVALIPRMALTSSEPPAGTVVRALQADQPRRHVVAAVRSGAEAAPGVSRVLAALRTVQVN
ncbi:LysR family transcriptional regulator [Streptomyces sp. A7024]|uniref:LysR family transcriptional regulator n=1 Tax=Streptomyces coryli TaxID=1128680 RepID=A0A6G4UBU8_9ACTN|nr:LysR family transcriptional regulator [Streptomyces coryli]